MKRGFDFKEEIETYKVQAINEIKNALLQEKNTSQDAITTYFDIDAEAYLEPSRISTIELFCKDSPFLYRLKTPV